MPSTGRPAPFWTLATPPSEAPIGKTRLAPSLRSAVTAAARAWSNRSVVVVGRRRLAVAAQVEEQDPEPRIGEAPGLRHPSAEVVASLVREDDAGITRARSYGIEGDVVRGGQLDRRRIKPLIRARHSSSSGSASVAAGCAVAVAPCFRRPIAAQQRRRRRRPHPAIAAPIAIRVVTAPRRRGREVAPLRSLRISSRSWLAWSAAKRPVCRCSWRSRTRSIEGRLPVIEARQDRLADPTVENPALPVLLA